MNLKQYQNLMKQIQMPTSCEQAILDQIANPQPETPPHHRISRNRLVWAAAAAAACLAVTGVVGVSAAQNSGWFSLFFSGQSNSAEQESYTGCASAFSADLDYFSVQLLDVYADESSLYYAIRLTPQDDLPKMPDLCVQNSCDENTLDYPMVDGISLLKDLNTTTTGGCSTTPEDSGSYLYVAKLHIDGKAVTLKTGSEITLSLCADGFTAEETSQNVELGTLSFTLDLEQAESGRICETNAQWQSGEDCFQLNTVTLTPLTVTIDGMANSQAIEQAEVQVILDNGSKISTGFWSVTYADLISSKETFVSVSGMQSFDQPIDPNAVTAIQIGTQIIPLS